MNLAVWVERNARQFPAFPAVADGDRVHANWRGFADTVARVAGGLVSSQRGARGGYRLARPLNDIPVSEVISVIDGPIALVACVDGSPAECESSSLCPVRGRWDPVNGALQEALGRG